MTALKDGYERDERRVNIQRLTHIQTHIQEGAIFIADSHYPHHGEEIIELLSSLPSNTPQLFLMGDIFDILFDHLSPLIAYNQRLIDLINHLSESIEIFYFEGNHDFNLQRIFPKVTIYPLAQQPQIFQLNKQKVALAHGDRYAMGLGYQLYTKFIRSSIVMKYLPFKPFLLSKQLKHLRSKTLCHHFDGFEQRIEKILAYYDHDLIIEGHFHQGIRYKNYISLPSLLCQKKIAVVEKGQIIFKEFGYNESLFN